MMLDLAFPVTRFLARGALVAGALALAACSVQRSPADRGGTAPRAQQPAASVDLSAPVRVAMLVPLGAEGGAAEVAGALVNGARLAAQDAGDAGLDLKVYDTVGNAAGAATAATRAIAEGARLIVGPLIGANAQAVAPIAAAAGVNVISFSTTPSVAGGNVYLIGMLAQSEADRIVRYAAQQGRSRIALMTPDNDYGAVALDAVRSAAARANAQVVAIGAYPRSFEGIEAMAPGFAAQVASSAADAVLIADSAQGLQAAASFLNFNNVSPGRYKYLGLGGWDRPATRQEPALHGGWFAAPDPAVVGRFETRYRGAFGERPHPLAVLGYDAVTAAASMLSAARAGGYEPFNSVAITDPGGFRGATGDFRFLGGGLNERSLAVLEVTPNGFVVIDPAPSGFGAGL